MFVTHDEVMARNFAYPEAKRDESAEYEYFGEKIADPYRWLEDPDSEETRGFVEAQNAVTLPYIDGCPERRSMAARLTAMWDYPRYGPPFREGDRYYYFHNTGVQNQPVLYVQKNLTAEPEVFFDVNALAKDGTVALNTYAFSEDGKIFAYALSKSGSDWITIRFMDVDTRKDFGEELERIKFSSIEWTHDNVGIFYSRYPDSIPDADGTETHSVHDQKLYYHRLGTPQASDVLVLDFPENPDWMVSAHVSDCGRYLFASVTKECKNNLMFFTELGGEVRGRLELKPILAEFEADISYVTNVDSKALFFTNRWAPNSQVVAVDLDDLGFGDDAKWRPFIPEHRDTLDWAAPAAYDKLVLCYQRDVRHRLQVNSLHDGRLLHEFDLAPGPGSVAGFSARKKFPDMFYKFESYVDPGSVFRVDFGFEPPWEPRLFRKTEVPNFDELSFTMEQVFYKSHDGTHIPMYVIHHDRFARNGTAPAWLYGYGGFSISLLPRFSLTFLNFIRFFRGVVAIPNIRGGGEYGQHWHDMGRLLKKQHGFRDFQAAAEYLHLEKYTCPAKLTINGYSNGGLLVAACLNQKPAIFGAGVAGVGVMDLMRFHKFTIGYAWTSDYGNPETDEADFRNLLTLSPLHNVSKVDETKLGPGGYPAVLLLTADHDDRVVPLHSLKLIAELQHAFGSKPYQKNPLMIRVDTKAGHGAGKPTGKVIEEAADVFAYITRALNLVYHTCPDDCKDGCECVAVHGAEIKEQAQLVS